MNAHPRIRDEAPRYDAERAWLLAEAQVDDKSVGQLQEICDLHLDVEVEVSP